MNGIISAKNDVIFKKLFADNNEEILTSFLSAALSIPQEKIVDIYIKNPEIPQNITDGKLSHC